MAFRGTFLRNLAAKMTAAERDIAIREANEKMRQYHMNRSSFEKLRKNSKYGSRERDNQQLLQFGIGKME